MGTTSAFLSPRASPSAEQGNNPHIHGGDQLGKPPKETFLLQQGKAERCPPCSSTALRASSPPSPNPCLLPALHHLQGARAGDAAPKLPAQEEPETPS